MCTILWIISRHDNNTLTYSFGKICLNIIKSATLQYKKAITNKSRGAVKYSDATKLIYDI